MPWTWLLYPLYLLDEWRRMRRTRRWWIRTYGVESAGRVRW